MKQRGHTWIAIRAVGLIQDDPKTQGLAEILAPWVQHSYIGCWLPDMHKFKKGHGIIGNHTFKNTPYFGPNASRFVVDKAELLMALDENLDLHNAVASDTTLDPDWWDRSFKADQKEGQHLPNCLSSLFDTIADMLLLGDEELDDLVPGSTGYYGPYLDEKCTISKEQVSTFFFMMSHYIADCFMPCHADKRALAAYVDDEPDMHRRWESHWETEVGTYFQKQNLKNCQDTSAQIIAKAKALDTQFGLTFHNPLTWPSDDRDMWETAVLWCRGSFAFASMIFPEDNFPYDGDEKPVFDTHFTDEDELARIDHVVLQSAVYATASTWKCIWRKFKQ